MRAHRSNPVGAAVPPQAWRACTVSVCPFGVGLVNVARRCLELRRLQTFAGPGHCADRSLPYGWVMLGKLLSGGEFGQWASFVTPAFFDVMPTKPLWHRFKGLVAGTRDPRLYARVVRDRQALLARSSLAVLLEGPGERRDADLSSAGAEAGMAAEARAACVVALYFHQILHGGATLLDLRRQAFSAQPLLTWRPAPWIAEWDGAFIEALRQIYVGFYRADESGFRAGLAALNLTHSEDVFRQHFGGGQGAVRFEVKHFVATFHQVFLRCRDAHTRLHPDFLLLGLYLASLYDHLEQLGVAVDVGAAFEHASVLEPQALVANGGARA
jgi:hypothetical protein